MIECRSILANQKSTHTHAHSHSVSVFMAAHSNGQAIIFCSCGYYLLSFLPRLFLALGNWTSTILPHMMWPQCEFRMHVWNVRMRLAENTGRKKSPKNSHLRTIAQLCRAVSSQLRHVSTIKKLVKQQYLLVSSQYGELRPTSGWDQLGHCSKFQPVLRLGFISAPTLLNGGQPNFAQCLAISCTATLYIHFWGLLPHNGILPGAEFTMCRPSLAFSYIANVTAQQSSSGRQANFAAWYKEWNYGTFADGATYTWQGGHHNGNRLHSS